MLDTAQPKPVPRKRLQASNRRVEAKIKRQVRAACVERDGCCRHLKDTRLGQFEPPMCDGRSEWAHLGNKKRFKTRGMAPEVRHTTQDSLILCQYHHKLYDSGRLAITALSERGADGPLRFERI